MSDSSIADNTKNVTDKFSAPPPPQFGLSDMVDAFTAMRHELRTQSKEGREQAESMRASIALLSKIESTLDQKLTIASDDGNLKNMIALIIDTDISLRRAVAATSEQAADPGLTEQQLEISNSVRQAYNQLGLLSRWFSRKFYRSVIQSVESSRSRQLDATVEGLQLVLGRLQRTMEEQNLMRVETVGKAFDAETMKAVSAIHSEQIAEGCVAEEITPSYFYRNQLIRFAEVRVSRAQA